MIDFAEIPEDGEIWELFARDFLQEVGFFIESSPDRGADGGRDLLVSEKLKGHLGNYNFKWLVSCKHFAKSGNSVAERHEPNIRERLDAFNADGFIGFYSTLPSAGFNTRLENLRDNRKIKDYKFFDHKLIENYLIRIGYSDLLMRYFPKSYAVVKPLHLIAGEYIPLNCKNCGKDLLDLLYKDHYSGNIIFVIEYKDEKRYIKHVYWTCKGDCGRTLEERYRQKYDNSVMEEWEDLGDLVIPVIFLRFIITFANGLRDGSSVYTDDAYENMQTFIMALSQKVLREMTEKEKQRAVTVFNLFSAY